VLDATITLEEREREKKRKKRKKKKSGYLQQTHQMRPLVCLNEEGEPKSKMTQFSTKP